MKRMKTLAKYVIWIIAFWILSDFLIQVGINSTYKPIETIDSKLNQTSITDRSDYPLQIIKAEATLVNGRIIGTLTNSPTNNISNKYIKLEVFSKQNNLLATRYIDIGEMGENESKPIEIYFKANRIGSYRAQIVDEKLQEEGDLKLLPNNIGIGEIFWGVMIILIIAG